MNILLSLIVTLLSYNARIDHIGNKSFVVFEMTLSSALPTTYAADYSVTFLTEGLPVTQNYHIVLPSGASGFVIYPFRVNSAWQIQSFTLVSWGEYQQ